MEAARTKDNTGDNNLEEENEPKPGDMVEFPRGVYKHYGVAVDKEHVIHLTSAEPVPPGYHFSSNSGGLKAKVKKERISSVAWNNKYQVNNMYDHKMKPRKPEYIVSLAEAMVGQEMDYSLLQGNCEHFVTMLRYGDPQSKQATDGIIVGSATLGSFTSLPFAMGAAFVIFKGVQGKYEED